MMQTQFTDEECFQYLLKTSPWPKEVYDALVLKRKDQREVLAEFIERERNEN